MAPRALKLGTRRSALARAQSAAIARRLEQLHAGLCIELVGIDTRGDRITDRPLSAVDGKEFFTAEIDAALLDGQIDLTVHSFKDLSLERDPRIRLAAVPVREPPHDVVVFAADAPARRSAGHELLIGSSSPRRASFVPPFLRMALPRPRGDSFAGAPPGAAVRLVALRGNVDSRLRRLHEPRGSPRQLDGVVLAFAGLARLWAEPSFRPTLEPLLAGLPRMVLPLSSCPPAPAQGALAVECRGDDASTAALLSVLDHAPTREAVFAERAQLALLGGGCQQPFGAVSLQRPGLGGLLLRREARERDGELQAQPTQVLWKSAVPLPPVVPPVRAWDGTAAGSPACVSDQPGEQLATQALSRCEALFVAHRRALPAAASALINPQARVWVPGVATWQGLAQQGIWVEGCAEGWGIGAIAELLTEPWLQLPPPQRWTVLTHRDAAQRWSARSSSWPAGTVIATYHHEERDPGPKAGEPGPPADSTHVYWASSAQFECWQGRLAVSVQHACGPGKTYERLRAAGVHNLHMFPGVQQWREWLQG